MELKMANNSKLDENQLDMFANPTPSAEVLVSPVVDKVSPAAVKETVVEAKAVELPVEAPKLSTPVVEKAPEIAGQVKTDINSFITDIPYENRFVSLSLDSKSMMITPLSDDGSITLKDMKELYPTHVTQIQKVGNDSIIDTEHDNMMFLEKLQNMVDSKKLNLAISGKGKEIDKSIDEEVKFISKLERGEIELIDDDEPSAPAQAEAPKNNKRKLKM